MSGEKLDTPTTRRTEWPGVGGEMLKDPLGELARRHRRDLITASSLGILVSTTGLPPRTIAGIELVERNRGALLWALALIIVYQFAAFVVYAWSDRMAYSARLQKLGYMPQGLGDVPVAALPAAARTFLDMVFPFVLALFALTLLTWVSIPSLGSPAESSWLGTVARVSLLIACALISLLALTSAVERFVSLVCGRRREINPDTLDRP